MWKSAQRVALRKIYVDTVVSTLTLTAWESTSVDKIDSDD